MKKIMLCVLFTAVTFVFVSTAKAQVNVNINIGVQPEWGPSGYDYAEYYYMPDIETYYYVPRREFIYFSGNRWVFSPVLPPMYSNYDLYGGYKVVFKSKDAYKHFNEHKIKYAKYKHYDNRQPNIKYKHDNGNHYGQNKSKDKGSKKGRGKSHNQ
jgi:hypothetical protein